MGDLIFTPLGELLQNELHEVTLLDQQCFGKNDGWKIENFNYPLCHKYHLSYCARHNNSVVGFIVGSTYEFNKKMTSHINRIAVSADFNKSGIGSQLIQFFIEKSRELNCWGATLEFNQKLGLQSFYSKNLFSEINEKKAILSYLKAKNKLNRKDDFLSKNKLLYFIELTQNP